MRYVVSFLTLVFCLVLISCKEDPEGEVAQVTEFSPAQGDIGTEVTILGSNFGTDPDAIDVFFNSSSNSLVVSVTDTELIVEVPAGARDGKIQVSLNKGRKTASSSSFAVTSGSWNEHGDLEEADLLDGWAPLFIMNGKVYVHSTEGEFEGDVTPPTFLSYDPVTKTSVALEPIHETYFIDGDWGFTDNTKGYIVRHNALNAYDLATGEWTQKTMAGAFPQTHKIEAAFYSTSKALAYVISGNRSVWTYNTSTGEWIRLTDMTFDPKVDVMVATNSAAYFIMNYLSAPSFWKFETATNQWQQLADYPGYAPNFAFVLDGDVYVGSTWNNGGETDGLWKYDAEQNDWILKAAPPAHLNGAIYFSINNKGYIGMGTDPLGDNYLHDLYEYVPD